MAIHLLIVDDESTIRKGLSSYMPWHELDCVVDSAVRDGAEAIEHIKLQPPDIVITDIKMPRVNGIEVARFVREHCPKTKVIILSGHADFEYARSALVYGVSDYVMKPVAKEVLLTAIKKLVGEIEKERIKSSDSHWSYEQLFRDLVENSKNHESILQKITASGLVLTDYSVIVFDCVGGSQMNDIRKDLSVNRPSDYFFIAHNDNLRNSLFWITQTKKADIMHICDEIVHVSKSLYAHTLSVGVSARHETPKTLPSAFHEAQEMLLHNFYTGSVVSLSPQEKTKHFPMVDAMHEEAIFFITQNLSNRSFAVVRGAVSALFMDLKNALADESSVRDLCKQIYYVCYGVLRKSDLVFLIPDFLPDIADAPTANELEKILLNMIEQAEKLITAQHRPFNPFVKKALNYIRLNYTSDITLESIAADIPVNPSHLSRIFKKEIGEALTEYINKIRVEKAKELLLTSEILVYEVASTVGFKDSTYFSQVFKKYTGMSPKDFKSARR